MYSDFGCPSHHNQSEESFSEKSEKKLLSEIENDILEEFSLNRSNLSGSENINFDGLVEWIEDEQLEEEIKKKV